MSQAKSFTDVELDQVLRYVSSTRYHHRNRAMILMSFLSGMRVGEIAALTIADVSNEDGTVKSEIRLSPNRLKVIMDALYLSVRNYAMSWLNS